MPSDVEQQNQRDGLPAWVWGAGVAVGVGTLGHILYSAGINSHELPPVQVGIELVLAMMSFTLAASARIDSKKNVTQDDWQKSLPRGDQDRMTEYDITID